MSKVIDITEKLNFEENPKLKITVQKTNSITRPEFVESIQMQQLY